VPSLVPNADDRLDLGSFDNFGQRSGHPAEDDDDFDAGIIELMFELTRRIERVDVYLNGTRADDAQHGEREARDVGEHYGDAVGFLHAKLDL